MQVEVLVWLVFCVGVGFFASSKGRSGFGWGLLAFLISPLISGIALACMKDLTVQEDVTKIKMENQHLRDRVVSNERMTNYRVSRVENDVMKLQTGHQGSLGQNVKAQIEEALKECPACAEKIRSAAIKCKHCGTMINQFIVENLEIVEPATSEGLVECPFCFEMTAMGLERCAHCSSPVG